MSRSLANLSPLLLSSNTPSRLRKSTCYARREGRLRALGNRTRPSRQLYYRSKKRDKKKCFKECVVNRKCSWPSVPRSCVGAKSRWCLARCCYVMTGRDAEPSRQDLSNHDGRASSSPERPRRVAFVSCSAKVWLAQTNGSDKRGSPFIAPQRR